MQIPMLPADKAAHALTGAVIFGVVGAVAAFAGYGPWARYAGAIAATAAGAGKEASDYLSNKRAVARGELPQHGVEFADFLATVGGAAFVWLAAITTEG